MACFWKKLRILCFEHILLPTKKSSVKRDVFEFHLIFSQLSDVVTGPSLETLKEAFKTKVAPAFREVRGLKAVNTTLFADLIKRCKELDNTKVMMIRYDFRHDHRLFLHLDRFRSEDFLSTLFSL